MNKDKKPKKPMKVTKEITIKIHKNSDYEARYDEMLIEHMGSGLSFESFAGLIRTTRSVLYQWIERHPSFADAKELGKEAQMLNNEQITRDISIGAIPGGSAQMQKFRMQNYHLWSEKKDIVTTNTTTTLSLEEFIKAESDKLKENK